jgi:hypothetical protein
MQNSFLSGQVFASHRQMVVAKRATLLMLRCFILMLRSVMTFINILTPEFYI